MRPLDARAFEILFAHEEESNLLIQVRRNQIFARWAAEQLRLNSSARLAYIRSFGEEEARPEPEEAILARVRADFVASGVKTSEERIHAAMAAAGTHAEQQVRAEARFEAA